MLEECRNTYSPAARSRELKILKFSYVLQWFCCDERISESSPGQSWYTPGNFKSFGKKAFTLIELMMVVAIIGTLAAIAVPNYLGFRERAMVAKTIETMRMMEKELITFNIDKGRYPDTLAEAGLDHLTDPWGHPYEYLNIKTSTGSGKRRKKQNLVPINEDFDLYSVGPDGKSQSPLTAKHSRDDIVRANNGGFLGKASSY